jgi:hypothetical protein
MGSKVFSVGTLEGVVFRVGTLQLDVTPGRPLAITYY